MEVDTFPAPTAGICEICKKPYGADDYVAVIQSEVHCQDCVIDLRLVEAA
jgi:hypothetical protein